MNIPSKIKDILKDYPLKKDTLGRSEDLIYFANNKYVLKISKDKEKLRHEVEMNDFLKDKLPVSQTIVYEEDNEYGYYLKTYLEGESLISEKYLKNPYNLILLLKSALDKIHNVDISNCPFVNSYSKGNSFIHGDFCLPNILVKDSKISGFIDLNDAGIGDKYADYSWCIWSFEYNLKTKEYTPILLKELGIEFNQELYERYTKMED